jgi:hypothetical protein
MTKHYSLEQIVTIMRAAAKSLYQASYGGQDRSYFDQAKLLSAAADDLEAQDREARRR